jgi:hypothetical protein
MGGRSLWHCGLNGQGGYWRVASGHLGDPQRRCQDDFLLGNRDDLENRVRHAGDDRRSNRRAWRNSIRSKI